MHIETMCRHGQNRYLCYAAIMTRKRAKGFEAVYIPIRCMPHGGTAHWKVEGSMHQQGYCIQYITLCACGSTIW